MKEINFTENQTKVFKELGVRLVYIFGSQIDGVQNKLSDIDIGVVFTNKKERNKDRKDRYVKLFDIFTDIFRDYKKVDLVFLQDTSLILQSRAVMDGQIIYSEDKSRRGEFDYKEYVMKHHADTQYFRDMRQQAILARI